MTTFLSHTIQPRMLLLKLHIKLKGLEAPVTINHVWKSGQLLKNGRSLGTGTEA